MKEIKPYSETIKEEVARLLNAEVEDQVGQVVVKKKRVLEISSDNRCFTCTLDHDISFEDISTNGNACNKAEVYLLPEEYSIFCLTLSEHDVPFPIQYQQWREVNPHIIRVCMESIEPPVLFAERLSAALDVLG